MKKNSPGTMPITPNPSRSNTQKNMHTHSINSKIPTSPSTKGNKSISNSPSTSRNVIAMNTSTRHPPTTASTITAELPNDTATNPAVYSDSVVSNVHKNNHTQPTSNNGINNTDSSLNFASIVAKEITPNREQAIVFNSIDGIPQKDYVIAIGQIVQPKNILFVSRISNNRFCIFLNSKEILESLIVKNPTITINGHEIQLRRLLNPAKRIVISNVCPSIPNTTILHALQNLDISPSSQINHLKAGINLVGYEHILSFRRQIYIKHEDIHKLPGSLTLSHNQSQFRVFFTDDTLTCYTCHKTGHTSNTCKKDLLNDTNMQTVHDHNPLLKPENSPEKCNDKADIILPLQPPLIHNTSENTNLDWLENLPITTDTVIIHSSPSAPVNTISRKSNEKEPLQITGDPSMDTTDNNKRPLSETASTPMSPTTNNSPHSPISKGKPNKKKPKISSRSNSFSQAEDNPIVSSLKPVESHFLDTNNVPISLLQYQYIIENFSNKSINIHTLLKQVNTDIKTIIDITEKIQPMIRETKMKAKLTRLRHLLFQSLPPSDQN
ncbi:unnamed protein product [Macrosiphum euphorbiae]|uniref:CCHC-type domain-containing protein n=2 Tax=Macrosiphum euphorbiae TaxID=13131 RepID=A0AAV0X4N9_9HEMI|nr:unnamed protein product [Macrosiphum euphorbiae]